MGTRGSWLDIFLTGISLSGAVSALAGTSAETKMTNARLQKTPDSTALPFRMFGAHCVALRLSLNVIPVSD
jgi:hypothetical protein